MAAPEVAAAEPASSLPPVVVDAGSDRRARNRERRKDRVYTAAVELFVAGGFDNTTMDDISEHADVARTTVFNHFQRKTAFLEEWSRRRRQRAFAAVQAEHLQDHSIGEILQRYMVELSRVSTASRRETVAMMSASLHSTNVLAHPELGHELARFVSRAQALGEVVPSVAPELAGLLLATGYFVTLAQWIEVEPAPFNLGEQLQRMLEIILSGLLPG